MTSPNKLTGSPQQIWLDLLLWLVVLALSGVNRWGLPQNILQCGGSGRQMGECRRGMGWQRGPRGKMAGHRAKLWGLSWKAQSSVPLSPKARGSIKVSSRHLGIHFPEPGLCPCSFVLVLYPAWVQRGLPGHPYLGSVSLSPRQPSLDGVGGAGRSWLSIIQGQGPGWLFTS